jgi:hypothetical protein
LEPSAAAQRGASGARILAPNTIGFLSQLSFGRSQAHLHFVLVASRPISTSTHEAK